MLLELLRISGITFFLSMVLACNVHYIVLADVVPFGICRNGDKMPPQVCDCYQSEGKFQMPANNQFLFLSFFCSNKTSDVLLNWHHSLLHTSSSP